MERDLFVESPALPLWKFVFGYLEYTVRPTDARRLDPTKPKYVQIPEGSYVELLDWTEGLESHPTTVIQVKDKEEVITEAAKFIVAGHYL